MTDYLALALDIWAEVEEEDAGPLPRARRGSWGFLPGPESGGWGPSPNRTLDREAPGGDALQDGADAPSYKREGMEAALWPGLRRAMGTAKAEAADDSHPGPGVASQIGGGGPEMTREAAGIFSAGGVEALPAPLRPPGGVEGLYAALRRGGRRRAWVPDHRAEEQAVWQDGGPPADGGKAASPAELDLMFQRDARRYGGAFGLY